MASSEAGTQPPAADLGWALGTLLRGYLKRSADAVGELPGGARGYQVLATVGSGACGNQAAIAESTGLDRTVMTYLLDDLESAGLVVRTPDPSDRRARRITLTDAGRTRLDELTARMHEVESELLGGLPAEEAAQLRSALTHAARSLDENPHGVCAVVDEVAEEVGAAREA